MARITAVISIIALLVLLPAGMEATQYIVGDADGWNSDVDYYSWMDGKTFHVGDSLGGACPIFLLSVLHAFILQIMNFQVICNSNLDFFFVFQY